MKHHTSPSFIPVILTLGISSAISSAEIDGREIPLRDCPAKVRATIKANADGGRVEEVEFLKYNGRKIYVADIEFPGSRDLEIYVFGNGNLLKIREDIPFRKLPAAARKTVKSFPGSVDDVDKETAGGVVTYQVELDRLGKPDLNLKLSADGKVLDKSTGEDPYDLDFSAPLEADLRIEQPAGSALASGGEGRSFGTVPVGGTGVARSFVVKNSGSAELDGLALRATGSHAADFKVTPVGQPTLAPGESGTFIVRFSPTAEGARTASLYVASNDPGGSPFVIRLSGFGSKS